MPNRISLSPITRLTTSFDYEMSVDKNGVFSKEVYEGYIELNQKSMDKRDQLVKALFFANAALLLLINHQSFVIPSLGFDLSGIPSLLEIMVLYSSMSFYLLCVAFMNSQCYSALVDQFGIKYCTSVGLDPDFINASKKDFEFFLKIYRVKLNIWSDDFFIPGRRFRAFANYVNVQTIILLSLFPIIHFSLIAMACIEVLQQPSAIIFKLFFVLVVSIVNVAGVLVVAASSTEFDFEIADLSAKNEKDETATIG